MLNRPTLISATVLALGAIAVPLSATNGGNHAKHDRAMRDYVVTVENLTPAGSQPLSPPLVVVHNHHTRVWSPGTLASSVVAGVAEDANNGPAVAAFSSLPGVRSATTGVDVGASAAAPIGPGASQSYVVRGRPGDRLSLVSMLVNTNDGFTGLHGVRLRAGHTVSVRVNAYDAGSEMNNQLASHIPGPAGGSPFVRDPEGAVIQMHPGLVPGVGDIDTSVYGWTGPVAKITVAPKS
ncbi:MAG: spondin domain-containing protein [Actinobacteria bacterium]|nr:spondin domain-containing protein [Actinomycetota bacterium]